VHEYVLECFLDGVFGQVAVAQDPQSRVEEPGIVLPVEIFWIEDEDLAAGLRGPDGCRDTLFAIRSVDGECIGLAHGISPLTALTSLAACCLPIENLKTSHFVLLNKKILHFKILHLGFKCKKYWHHLSVLCKII